MKIAIRVKPLKATPFFATPIRNVVEPLPKITEKNDGPACSMEQVRDFQENWERHVPPRVIKQTKRKGNILHGAFSANMQMPAEFHRPTHDIDVWSMKPSSHAKEIENEIDRCAGCDIAHVEETKVLKKQDMHTLLPPSQRPLEDEDEIKFKRFTVVTKPRNDVDVDYSIPPDDRPLKKTRVNGVWHESLEGAYERAQSIRYRPMRAGRAAQDIKRIEDYWLSKGKVIK